MMSPTDSTVPTVEMRYKPERALKPSRTSSNVIQQYIVEMRYKPERALKRICHKRSLKRYAVTTQAREGIETLKSLLTVLTKVVTTQVHPVPVPGKKI